MSVSVRTQDGTPALIKVVSGIGKKSNKPWKGISIQIGDWKTLVFAKTPFEMKYLEEILGEAE